MRININQQKRFKQKDIDEVKKSFPFHYYPERYKDLDGIEVKDYLTLVNFDDVVMPDDKEGNYQPHRLSGLNPKYDEIARSIHTQGYKLGEGCPPALFYSNELAKFEVITGFTRGGILRSNYVENFPVTTYRAKKVLLIRKLPMLCHYMVNHSKSMTHMANRKREMSIEKSLLLSRGDG